MLIAIVDALTKHATGNSDAAASIVKDYFQFAYENGVLTLDYIQGPLTKDHVKGVLLLSDRKPKQTSELIPAPGKNLAKQIVGAPSLAKAVEIAGSHLLGRVSRGGGSEPAQSATGPTA